MRSFSPRYPRLRVQIVFLIAAAAIGVVEISQAEDPDEVFKRDVAPFLEKHCIACHGPEKQKSRIRYDDITGYEVENGALWTKVHEALSAGEMPPEEEGQPGEEEVKKVLDWIGKAQIAASEGTVRRLNRRELSAALRDLTGLQVNYAGGLPEDGKLGGFDTGATALQDASDSVEQVLDVTRRAVEGIRFLDPSPGKVVRFDFSDERFKDIRKVFRELEEQGINSKGKDVIWEEGKGLLLRPKWLGERDSFTINVPGPMDRRGVVRVTLEAALVKNFEEVPNPHLLVSIGGKDLEYREVVAEPDKPLKLVYEVQIEDLAVERDGVGISLRNMVEMPYGIKGFENDDRTKPEDKVPGGGGLYRPAFDRKKTPTDEQPVPFILLQNMEIDYDHVAQWPPVSWGAGAVEVTDDDASAKRLLGLWMERAWRRPVDDAQQGQFFALYQRLRKEGMEFDAALRAAFQSVLLSGPFRYLGSPSDPDKAIGQHAIASRMSFMLTGGPPDSELRELAAKGKMSDPRVIDEQVDRLLDGTGNAPFFEPFVTQWLEMGQPITLVMDYFQKVDFRFGRFLKDSMKEETVAYVAELFRSNRPAREFIDSDWAMMNNSLARHYGYEGIGGGHLRKVNLKSGDPRGGGVLGHAGIQSMLCWMGDNWVIYRGAWALRHVLDDPPPPPPLEVPELDPTSGENRGKSFRELLRQHQEEENCAVCHRTMDPMGFAFQNFDISGRWRDVEHEKYIRNELDGKIEWRGDGKTRKVDAEGQLPRGETFSSFSEAKKQIISHYLPDLLRGVMKNLVIYGTGRRANVQDLAEIREILSGLENKGYPMRELLKAFFKSRMFLER